MKKRGNMTHKNNEFKISGVSIDDLKETYGTPLYILDQDYLEDTIRVFKNNFHFENMDGVVSYASKALLNIPLAQILNQQDLSFDVASKGEIYVLKEAGVPMSKVYFHGNNKTLDELDYAIEQKIGCIVVDNHQEFANLKALLVKKDTRQNVLLRINPHVDTDTHKYIQTSSATSKFGESIQDDSTIDLIHSMIKDSKVILKGFHSHIGSQIFDAKSFYQEAEAVFDFYQTIQNKFDVTFPWVNLGGGFGVYYSKKDRPFKMETFLKEYQATIQEEIDKRHLEIERVIIEPGRSMINDGVSTLYTVGGTKTTYGGKHYLFVDGGMSDNIRPALYDATYEAAVFSDSLETQNYTVAGKLCESGDVLIEDINLPIPKKDDLLLIPATGAYTFSMSSRYNKALRPAMVRIKDRQDFLMVKRESLADLTQNDVRL